MTKFKEVENNESLYTLAKLANEIWHEAFAKMLSSEQIDYMVNKYQSYSAIKNQLNDGYSYFLIKKDDQYVGYIGLRKENEKRINLFKLYLLKSVRGTGLSDEALDFAKQFAKDEAVNQIYLTVNKNNSHAIEVYSKYGFKKIEDVVKDIGSGFVMDDYIMEYNF